MNRLFLLFLILISSLAYSNSKGNLPQLISDSTEVEEDNHILMISISYTTNNTDNKNLLDIKMPSLIGDIYFFSKSGLWSSFAYTSYLEANTNTYETELSLGYQKYLFENLDIDLSYSWYQFKGDTLYSGIDYNHKIVLSTGIDIDPISVYIDNSVLFGNSKNYFLDFSVSLNLDWDNLFTSNDNLMFSPTIMSSFGTNNYIITDIIPKQRKRKNGKIIRLPPEIVTSIDTEFVYQNFNIFLLLIYLLIHLWLLLQ